MAVNLRTIKKEDNEVLARIIRASLVEFNVPKVGTVYDDPDTDRLFELFGETAASYYLVAEENGTLVGGCGVFPTPGLPDGYAELVKLYLTNETRGKGFGKLLMEKCFREAKAMGYTHLYLESFPQLAKAVSIYQKAGFIPLTGPLGNSGHFACTIWMIKEL